jgi:tripartite-type tricarboxylate transporter receptor subunit TctC
MRAVVKAFIVLMTMLSQVAMAQSSDQPIRLVVPYPAGGITDILARTLATALAPAIGQPVIVDNRPGASGIIASNLVRQAKPDGLTLLFTNVGPSAIVPAIVSPPPYDPTKDFTAISLAARTPLLLVVNAATPFKDVAGLIDMAKKSPGKVTYSSAGMDSVGRVATERFSQAANIKLLHVPYQGQAPSLLAVVSGEVQMLLTAPSSSMFEMVKAQKIRLIGVASDQPTSLAPGVVPISKTVPGFEAQYWFGIVGPAKMQEATVKRLNDGFVKVLTMPSVVSRFATLGSEAAASSPQQFQSLINTDAARWSQVARSANIRMTN